jgi:hypothetical protein
LIAIRSCTVAALNMRGFCLASRLLLVIFSVIDGEAVVRIVGNDAQDASLPVSNQLRNSDGRVSGHLQQTIEPSGAKLVDFQNPHGTLRLKSFAANKALQALQQIAMDAFNRKS